MAFDLTGSSPTYNASGKFSYSLNGGTASYATNLIPTSGNFSVIIFTKTGATGAIQVATGSVGTFWMGKDASNNAVLHYGNGGTEVTIGSSVNITDNAWHMLAWCYNATTGSQFFVDGTSAGTNATLMSAAGATYANGHGVKTFQGAGGTFDWSGEVDEHAIFTSVLYSSGFTVPSAAYANNTANLKALWHFDNNLLDTTSTATDTPVNPGVGSLTITGYAPTITQTGAQSVTPGVGSLTITGYAPTIAQSSSFTANIYFSPGNWNVSGSSAKTINAGAYFKTLFGGTTCVLAFDMTNLLTPYPEISYQIDGYGAWTTVNVAATVTLTVPSDTSDYATKPGHFLEVRVKSMTETQARYSTQATAVALTGITLDSGKSLTYPSNVLPTSGYWYGDSITEGVRTVNGTATNDTDRNDAWQSWSLVAAKMLGSECGNIGFGGTGWATAGSGSVPALTTSYNNIYSGVARTFSPAPDYIVINEGTNDSGDVTASATTVLNGLLTATPATTMIFVLRPFNGTTHASQLQAAIAACNTPTRCVYIDTAGFFTTANSYDSLHPYGVENINHIAPLVANAIRPYIVTASIKPTATKTVTTTLQNKAGTLQTGLTGLEWEWMDTLGIVIDSGTGATTDGSGVFSQTVHTNLATSGIGYLKITNTTGAINTTYKSFFGPVAVT